VINSAMRGAISAGRNRGAPWSDGTLWEDGTGWTDAGSQHLMMHGAGYAAKKTLGLSVRPVRTRKVGFNKRQLAVADPVSPGSPIQGVCAGLRRGPR
jgi:hypothetical protein